MAGQLLGQVLSSIIILNLLKLFIRVKAFLGGAILFQIVLLDIRLGHIFATVFLFRIRLRVRTITIPSCLVECRVLSFSFRLLATITDWRCFQVMSGRFVWLMRIGSLIVLLRDGGVFLAVSIEALGLLTFGGDLGVLVGRFFPEWLCFSHDTRQLMIHLFHELLLFTNYRAWPAQPQPSDCNP